MIIKMKRIQLIIWLNLLVSVAFGQRADVTKTGSFPEELEEVSGMIYVGKDSLIVINDSGNEPILYLINNESKILKKTWISNVKNRDWEDIAIDNEQNIFIANIGNNANKRKKLFIYSVPLKDVLSQDTVKVKTIGFHYPEQESFPPKETQKYYDAEALWADDQFLYILTKNRTNPSDGIAQFYRLPKKPGNYAAKNIGTYFTCSNSQIKCWVTAADYHPASGLIAVLTTTEIHLLRLKNNILKVVKIYKIPGIKQRESLCFGESINQLYMADEFHKLLRGGNLYKVILE